MEAKKDARANPLEEEVLTAQLAGDVPTWIRACREKKLPLMIEKQWTDTAGRTWTKVMFRASLLPRVKRLPWVGYTMPEGI